MGLREVFRSEATDGSSDGTSNEEIVNARAAALIYDAVDGEDRPLPAHGQCHLKSHLLRSRWVWVIRLWSVLGMLIEFFVEPHWCLRHSTGRCPNSKFYMSDFPKFGQQSIWMLALNVIYFMPFVLDIGLRVLAYEGSFSTVSQRSYVAVVNIYALVSFIDYFGLPTFDVLAFCRPLIFLALHHTVRREVKVVLSSIPQVLELFFLGFLLLLFFALVAIILFPITTEEGRMYFPSLLTGMWSLLVLLTTANFPDVMLPAYRVSRAAFLYFFLFMIVGMFFLVNVLTAIVMSAYQRQVGVNRLNLKETRQKKLNQAYELLTIDPDTHEEVPLTLERMDAVLEELSHCRNFETETSTLYSQISAQVDSSGDGIVSRSEFGSLIWVITKHLSEKSPPPTLEKCFPTLAESHIWQVAKSIATSDWPGFVIDILLVLNLIDMIVKLWPEIIGSETAEEAVHDRRAAIAGWVQQTFTLILVFETVFKVATIGLDRYLSSHINQFDFAITASVVVIYLLNCFPEVLFSHATLARISQCARLFRFCRILDRYQPYHHFGRIAFKLIPPAVDVLTVVALICYAFAVLGVFLFGGLINDDPTDPNYEAVAKSSYGQADYKVNNFNDIGMGMVTLFELLVVNNWFMIADGFSAACGPGARAYFVAFWAFGVLVGLNLFLSTIIEAFTTEYEELEEADFRLPDFSEATALSNALYVDVKQSLQIPLDDTDPTHEPLPSYRSSDGP